MASPRRRLTVLWCLALVGAVALVARLVMLQATPPDRLLDEGVRQRLRTIPLQAERGSIVDRNGADLAISVPQKTIAADARAVADPRAAASELAPLLGRDADELEALLSSNRPFVYLARQVDEEIAESVRSLGFEFVWAYTESKRFLPAGPALGISVVGHTDVDLNGVSGLELAFDELLRGSDGELVVEQGIGGRTIPGGERQVSPATPGATLVLTLDRGLQFEAEQLLLASVDATGALGGTIVVTHVPTGDVLVAANVVRPPDGTARLAAENRALTWTFEPGSVNKLVTMAGVIEDGMAGPDTTRTVGSAFQVGATRWVDEHRSGEDQMSLTEIFRRSSNVGTMLWADDLGAPRFDHWLRAFGLGRSTGVGFPGESAGLLPPTEAWSASSLPTIAIGQGLAVTPLQMLTVYNSVANGGRHLPPRLVLGTKDPDGHFAPAPTPQAVPIVSEETTRALTGMLEAVVSDGTGQRAQVPGFSTAGKTGTAWKPLATGGYGEPGRRKLVTTFVGFLPASRPELSIIVVLDEPQVANASGGSTAAPVFAEMAAYAARHLRIPPDAETIAVVAPGERLRADPRPAPVDTASGG